MTSPDLAAKRYEEDRGPAARRRQAALAATVYGCCGEPIETGHHPFCSKFEAPASVEVHPDQETLA